MSRLPDFVGIGAPKAGTTWLFRCLDDHPEIHVAPCKETNFFDYDTVEGRLDEYAAHFAEAGDAEAVGEISTRYLASGAAPARIAEILPEARLFVSLRDPVAQVESHYWHLRRQNFHQWDRSRVPQSLEEAIEAFPERLLGPAFYHRHLVRWFEHVPRSRMHVILHDDIRESPRTVVEALYRYLGVDPGFRPPSLEARGDEVRRGRSPRGRIASSVHRFVYDHLNRNVYHPLKRVLGNDAARRIKEALPIKRVTDTVLTREGYPPMDASTRERLRETFAPDVEALESLLGRDLGRWR